MESLQEIKKKRNEKKNLSREQEGNFEIQLEKWERDENSKKEGGKGKNFSHNEYEMPVIVEKNWK